MALTIDNRAVLDAADLYRRADKDLRREMTRAVNREVNPWLRSAIRRNARGGVEEKLAGTARIRSGTNPAVIVGGGTRFSGGATATMLAGAYEFGAYNPDRRIRYDRRNRSRSGTHMVTRATAKQIPERSARGRFIMAAVADAAPMMVSAWVQVIAEAYGTGRG